MSDTIVMPTKVVTPEMRAMYEEAARCVGSPNVSARGRGLDPSDFLAVSISADAAGFVVNKPGPELRLVGVGCNDER